MTLAEKALEIAKGEIGKQEIPKGSNWGPHVKKYLNSVGLNSPNSWCMAFLYWCFSEAAKTMGVENPLSKTGGVLAQWNARKARYATASPRPGDIGILDHGKGLGHTFIVEAVNADGTLQTIEGNTNDDGSREGYEVCRRTRSSLKVKGFLRF